jgi:uncharacterized membrane protein
MSATAPEGTREKSVVTAATFLGIGLGGFFDGILFHQLLQTHNMLSAKLPKTSIPNIEANMFWDGVFHAATWVMTVVGVVMLWRAGRYRTASWTARIFVGSLFLGWGLFNLVEGLINHHVLNLHHVVERYGQSAFDYAFLLSGVVFSAGGWLAIRSARPSERR